MNIVFICVENSCRSQIAEILAKYFSSTSNKNNFYSCGTNVSKNVHPYVFDAIEDIFNINFNKIDYYPKNIDNLLNQKINIDYLISMGCDSNCPILEKSYDENWNLDDPKNLDYEKFKEFIILMADKVKDLIERLNND